MSDTAAGEAAESVQNLPMDLEVVIEPHPEVLEPAILNDDAAVPLEQQINPTEDDVQIIEEVVNVVEIEDTQPSPQPRPGRSRRSTPKVTKKRRISSSSPSPTKDTKRAELSQDDDDGFTCPICLDHWTLNGDHRLISLKCGHLFGLSCVKRWLQEFNAGSKCCPTCKSKVVMRDVRFLYAKRVQAVDNTEEIRLRDDLVKERSLRNDKEIELNLTRYELEVQRNLNRELAKKIEILQSRGVTMDVANPSANPYETYKLFLEKNIDISRDGGCRVMMYGKKLESLIVSQKSAQALFPGYGVRFIDAATFRLCQFLHVSNQKSVRDLGINYDEDRMITATMDKGAKLFDIHNKSVVNVFTPSESPLWACSFERDPNKMNFLYLGTNSTFVYDIRQPATFIREFKTEGDHTPILSIVPIPGTDDISFGGILVCKLQSLWFFEYTATQEVAASRLHVEGPFLAVSYDEVSKYLLISTRPSQKFTQARYIVARLTKQNQYIQLNVVTTFVGSKVQSQITRCSQINTGKHTVVAAYLQDTKMLTTWNVSNPDSKMQSLPSNETILDLCPVRLGNHMYLAALTDSKCRIYNMVT